MFYCSCCKKNVKTGWTSGGVNVCQCFCKEGEINKEHQPSKNDLLELCKDFEPVIGGGYFWQIIDTARQVFEPDFFRELAGEFELAETTIVNWSKCVHRPHPRLQKLVVEWIVKSAKE
jgi:hypothetical protein